MDARGEVLAVGAWRKGLSSPIAIDHACQGAALVSGMEA